MSARGNAPWLVSAAHMDEMTGRAFLASVYVEDEDLADMPDNKPFDIEDYANTSAEVDMKSGAKASEFVLAAYTAGASIAGLFGYEAVRVCVNHKIGGGAKVIHENPDHETAVKLARIQGGLQAYIVEQSIPSHKPGAASGKP